MVCLDKVVTSPFKFRLWMQGWRGLRHRRECPRRLIEMKEKKLERGEKKIDIPRRKIILTLLVFRYILINNIYMCVFLIISKIINI